MPSLVNRKNRIVTPSRPRGVHRAHCLIVQPPSHLTNTHARGSTHTYCIRPCKTAPETTNRRKNTLAPNRPAPHKIGRNTRAQVRAHIFGRQMQPNASSTHAHTHSLIDKPPSPPPAAPASCASHAVIVRACSKTTFVCTHTHTSQTAYGRQ